VARKDRERARKRHAIERARKESGIEARPREERPSSDRRPPSRPRTGGPQRGRGSQLKKLQVGDVDRRGRVFKRNMVLHPRTAMFISLAVIAAAIVGLFRPRLQWLSYLAFALGFLVFADSRPNWWQAALWIGVAVVCAVASAILLVAVL
jgi:hypothetical protein